jgi:hypothetical protein
LAPTIQKRLEGTLKRWNELSALPERTPAEIEWKKEKFQAFTDGPDASQLAQIAAIPIAQFYIPKTTENDPLLISDATFRRYWSDGLTPQGIATARAWATATEKRFFHWFLEFPDIIARGGFDCILGNPPYLGGTDLSGTFGHPFCNYVKWAFQPAGLSDLVVYFVRRIYGLLATNGFTAFITTNSIKDGDIRKDGLEQVLAQGAEINMVVRAIKWPGRANLIVSLLALHKGPWQGKRMLDQNTASYINAYFEDSPDAADPIDLQENERRVFKGPFFLGDGFLLSYAEADAMQAANPLLADVIYPVINGKELNNHPAQEPGRKIINFFDWPIEKAAQYQEAFERIERLVKPIRANDNRQLYRDKWWHYGENRPGLRAALRGMRTCFAVARTTKYLSFSSAPASWVFTDATFVLAFDRWDLYAVVQSTLHEFWARKYSGALKQDLRYSPSNCFETFAFPDGLWRTANPDLATIGERYHEHRKSLMLSLWLGLTDVYNLFHARDLSPAMVAKVSKKSMDEATRGYEGLLELRRLHIQLDLAILDAYGWQNLPLEHDFCEVETLAENDRVRYTISPAARKEVLRRLLKLNHERAEAEKAATTPPKPKRNRKSPPPGDQPSLYGEE